MILNRIKNNLRQFRRVRREAIYASPRTREEIVSRFHKLYYDAWHLLEQGGLEPFWLGTQVHKCPFDLWVYQEILHDLQPDLILETGTRHGGSALFFASICDLLDCGRILTTDICERENRPQHPRITYLHGSSTSRSVTSAMEAAASGSRRVLACLDSDHGMDHVLEEMRIYSRLVSVGSYLIVEDTNVNGHPVIRDHGPGPMEAVSRFLEESDQFVVDGTREKFFVTFNPRGYLKRVS